MNAGSLNAVRRERELDELASGTEVDILVVGGGVTGAGVALDAASRGLSVALLEARDLAFGTSRWSSKLVHGGLRYLAHADIGLAYESARERGILMTRTAPHLTRAMPQVFPFHRRDSRTREATVATGLYAGDALRAAVATPASVLPRPRRISAAEATALAPGLRSGLRDALLSFDGALTDDARLVLALARTAAHHGARILPRLRALELDGTSVSAREELSGERTRLRARRVINATGVWSGELAPSIRLRPSRGSHLVLDRSSTGISESAVMVPVPGESNRFVFLLPQPDGTVYLGLTDEPLRGPLPDVPTVPDSDTDFLLDVGSTVLARRLTREDVLGSYAGLRPLIDSTEAGDSSADLSRRHTVRTEDNGVLSVVGGKLTTYRRMACDAVDAAIGAGTVRAGACRTEWLPLVGATSRDSLSSIEAPQRLVARYGTEARRVAALGAVDPELARPLHADTSVTAAEVVWAVRHEGALNSEDVLNRRTRLGLVPESAERAEPVVAELVQRSLNGLSEW